MSWPLFTLISFLSKPYNPSNILFPQTLHSLVFLDKHILLPIFEDGIFQLILSLLFLLRHTNSTNNFYISVHNTYNIKFTFPQTTISSLFSLFTLVYLFQNDIFWEFCSLVSNQHMSTCPKGFLMGRYLWKRTLTSARTSSSRDSVGICKIHAAYRLFSHYIGDSLGSF